MGEWHEVEPRPYSPCDGCEIGFCSLSQKKVNGVPYTKTDYCQETCTTHKEWVKTGLRRALGGGILPRKVIY